MASDEQLRKLITKWRDMAHTQRYFMRHSANPIPSELYRVEAKVFSKAADGLEALLEPAKGAPVDEQEKTDGTNDAAKGD